MEDLHTGTINFYNATNEVCTFVIKPDNDDLYVAPTFPSNTQSDFQEGDRVTYETVKWTVYCEEFPRKMPCVPVLSRHLALEKAAVNIRKESEKTGVINAHR